MKKTIITLIATLVLISCSEQTPYQDGVKYIYKVKYSKSEFDDLITVEKTVVSGFASKILMETEVRQDKGSSSGYSIESNVANSTQKVVLPHPLGEYLNLTNFLPPPTIEFPAAIGDSIYSEHTVKFKHSPYNGLNVKGYIKVVGKEMVKNRIANDSCWVLKAHKFNTADTSATYYYSNKYGFIELDYQLGADNITITLDSLDID